MMVMAGVANIGVDGTGEFRSLAPHVVIVAGLQRATGIDEFADAAEVVFRVEEFVDRGGGGGDEFALGVEMLENGGA